MSTSIKEDNQRPSKFMKISLSFSCKDCRKAGRECPEEHMSPTRPTFEERCEECSKTGQRCPHKRAERMRKIQSMLYREEEEMKRKSNGP